jgi:hypothetical protein
MPFGHALNRLAGQHGFLLQLQQEKVFEFHVSLLDSGSAYKEENKNPFMTSDVIIEKENEVSEVTS